MRARHVVAAGLALATLSAAAAVARRRHRPRAADVDLPPYVLETAGPVLVGTLLSAVSVPLFEREAARLRDDRLFWLLVATWQLKLWGAFARHHMAYSMYERRDADYYHFAGVRIANRLRGRDQSIELPSLTGTNFIRFLTGSVYAIIGPSRLGGFLVFSWLAFWGQVFFHRAFALAVPEGDARIYRRLLFFTPSIVFWPSSIGKDAWMVFALGTGALGAAQVHTRSAPRGVLLAGLGIGLAARARPHVAAMLGAALASGHLLRSATGTGEGSPAARRHLLGVTTLAVVATIGAERFMRGRGLVTRSGIRPALEHAAGLTTRGGSQFVPAVAESPARIPAAAATVLFRPHLLEAHNAQSLIAAVETTGLLLLTLARIRSLVAALGLARRRPYIATALVFAGLFTVFHSAIGNFGALARQRVQLLPFYFVLLSIRPRRRRASSFDRP